MSLVSIYLIAIRSKKQYLHRTSYVQRLLASFYLRLGQKFNGKKLNLNLMDC